MIVIPSFCAELEVGDSFVTLVSLYVSYLGEDQFLLYELPKIPTLADRERELIEAFTRGEVAGFKYVYTRFRQRVLSYCIYYMGDKMLAEDAFQEVFTRVYLKRTQLRVPEALKSWILLITRSVCVNLLRSSKFTPEFVSISGEDSDTLGDTLDSPAEPIEYLIADDMLRVALSKIAPIYREAFLLGEFEGYSYEEIARVTNASETNVKVRITRAKKQLRILLAPFYKHEAGLANKRGRSNRRDVSNRSGLEGNSEEVAIEVHDLML